MKKIKIFLASSNELIKERQDFERYIYRKCKTWFERNTFLELTIWEDLSEKMYLDGSQKEYNRIIKESDIFILLADTKVGIYTAEEFENAFGAFKETKKPFIFTYFKNSESIKEVSINEFKEKLKSLKHYFSIYNSFDELWTKFNSELDRLETTHFEKNVLQNSEDSRTIMQGKKSVYIENANNPNINIQ